ncbi:putative ankyrin repeat protein RF_0381 [Cotesia glomerata]|uniref:putative ankyrin repeat protein RF_0381 n=1 Tax=Cotesia glomerata TaxID=32391 RepID=UPI001D01448B|nr:putative ankyrin repeat protein RF_0381 [Cotesia glomerata]
MSTSSPSTLTNIPAMLSTLPSINSPLPDGDPLLYHAAHQGNLPLILDLLTHQADINAQGFSGPALHESILQGHDSITSYLLQEGADLNLQSLNVLQAGFSPLNTAILSSNTFATELLLKMDANLLSKDSELNTPLHIAVKEENYALTALLLSSGASMTSINSNQETPFCLAVDSGNLELIELFINKGVFKFAPRLLNDSLIRAIDTGNVSVLQLMLLNGADVNFVSSYKCYTPLHHAVVANSLPIVEFLLQNGADASARTESNSLAIFFAAHRKNEPILDLLLEKHATIGTEGAKLLYEAVMENSVLLIKKVLSYKSYNLNVDGFAPDLTNMRLLEAAIVHNKHDGVRGLIFSGADVDLTDSRGVTFWDLAFEQRNFDFLNTAEL